MNERLNGLWMCGKLVGRRRSGVHERILWLVGTNERTMVRLPAPTETTKDLVRGNGDGIGLSF
jgi:hypothetical protein